MQDLDLRSISTLPQLDWQAGALRVWTGAFGAVGADVTAGTRLPPLNAQAGVGIPDGTDIAGPHRAAPRHGRLTSWRALRSVLPTALAHGVTTEQRATAALASIDRDAARFPDRPVLWPLLIGAWKRKGQA